MMHTAVHHWSSYSPSASSSNCLLLWCHNSQISTICGHGNNHDCPIVLIATMGHITCPIVVVRTMEQSESAPWLSHHDNHRTVISFACLLLWVTKHCDITMEHSNQWKSIRISSLIVPLWQQKNNHNCMCVAMGDKELWHHNGPW